MSAITIADGVSRSGLEPSPPLGVEPAALGDARECNREGEGKMSIYPRTEFEMTPDDLDVILKASKPTVGIMVGGSFGPDPQENANAAWKALGKKMGFEWNTVQPIRGKGNRFFTAIPSETEEQRREREIREVEEERHRNIAELFVQIKATIDALATNGCTTLIDVVFDGPPSHESGRFVEVENSAGASISVGKWLQRADGYWVLRIPLVQMRDTDVLRGNVEERK
jgi:hypothetical protein